MKVQITFDERVARFAEMQQREYGGYYHPGLVPGAAWWIRHLGKPENKISYLKFSCPCGCKDIVGIPVTQMEGDYGWKWDGNEELPTVTPSIRRLVGCGWHGHLTKGIFTEA